jgi:hypothetical protein
MAGLSDSFVAVNYLVILNEVKDLGSTAASEILHFVQDDKEGSDRSYVDARKPAMQPR